MAELRTGQERAGHLLAKGLTPITKHFSRLGICPFSFFGSTKGRNRKENHIEILGTKQAMKETVCLAGEPHFQQAPFQAAPESL